MIPSDEPERTVSSADLAQPIRDTADTILEPHNGSGPAGTSSPSGRYIRPVFHAEGGQGRVWVARDTALERDVALKDLRPQFAGDPAALARFLREARITGQLEHPGIVPVYELIEQGDRSFYAMRFVRGRTLTCAALEYHEKRRAGQEVALDLAALLHAFVVVCNTVGYAHSCGVLHRDLKGQNVLLGNFGEVVLLDWGLAKNLGQPEEIELLPSTESSDAELTRAGQTLGTPTAMAPEQASGLLDQIDQRTDIYGLGVILYEILTGQRPFAGTTVQEVLRKVREEDPPAPRSLCPEIPAGLEAICRRAMARNPQDRYSTAKELADAVQQWQESERRGAEEALRASEERLRLAVEAGHMGVWDWDIRSNTIKWSDNFESIHGLARGTFAGTFDAWKALLHPEDRGRVSAVVNRALETLEHYELEFRTVWPDGSVHWMAAQGRVFTEGGRPVRMVGVGMDITARKRSEEALRASEERFRLLADAIPQIVWTTGIDGRNEYLNERWFEYTGMTVQEVAGTGWMEALHPDDRERTTQAWVLALERGERFEIEYRIRRADGVYRWHLGIALPQRNAAGAIVRWSGTCTDIEDRK
jgi:serine/threonine-protein kinase